MMREVVQAMETGLLGQIGLVAFVTAFLLILAYVLTMPRRRREEAKNIPLNDESDHFTSEKPEEL